MFGNSDLKVNIKRWSKECGKKSEGGGTSGRHWWSGWFHCEKVTYNASMELGIFWQGLKTLVMNTVSKKGNKEYVRYYRP